MATDWKRKDDGYGMGIGQEQVGARGASPTFYQNAGQQPADATKPKPKGSGFFTSLMNAEFPKSKSQPYNGYDPATPTGRGLQAQPTMGQIGGAAKQIFETPAKVSSAVMSPVVGLFGQTGNAMAAPLQRGASSIMETVANQPDILRGRRAGISPAAMLPRFMDEAPQQQPQFSNNLSQQQLLDRDAGLALNQYELGQQPQLLEGDGGRPAGPNTPHITAGDYRGNYKYKMGAPEQVGPYEVSNLNNTPEAMARFSQQPTAPPQQRVSAGHPLYQDNRPAGGWSPDYGRSTPTNWDRQEREPVFTAEGFSGKAKDARINSQKSIWRRDRKEAEEKKDNITEAKSGELAIQRQRDQAAGQRSAASDRTNAQTAKRITAASAAKTAKADAKSKAAATEKGREINDKAIAEYQKFITTEEGKKYKGTYEDRLRETNLPRFKQLVAAGLIKDKTDPRAAFDIGKTKA